jgi:hypothetical protein
MMQMIFYTRTSQPEAAKVASALPCWHALVILSDAGNVPALAERRMS